MSTESPLYVVTGSTGHVGKQAVLKLLHDGRRVRAVVRNASSSVAKELAAKGAELAEVPKGSLDSDALTKAFTGASAVFILTPPIFGVDNLRAAYAELTKSHAKAIAASGVNHVVALSSWGAEQSEGTGYILPAFDMETEFNKLKANITFIRAGYFAENTDYALPLAKEKGIWPIFYQPDLKIPVIASKDIGHEVASRLQEKWQGKRIIQLEGPARLSQNEIAIIVGNILGKHIQVIVNPLDQCPIPWMAELIQATNTGHIHFNDHLPTVKGATSYEEVARESLGLSKTE